MIFVSVYGAVIVTKLQISEDYKRILYPPYGDAEDPRGTLQWSTERLAASAFPTEDYDEFDVERFLIRGKACT